MDPAFLKERLEKTKALIIAYEDAVTAIVSGQVQAYTLDTGQNVQTVTRVNLSLTQKALDILYNRCATMEARLNGSGTLTVRPAW